MADCTEGALMTLQLRHNIQASQAVNGANDAHLEPDQISEHLWSPS